MNKYRATLYLNGVQAIRTVPLYMHEIDFRIENWRRIYGERVKIEVEAA